MTDKVQKIREEVERMHNLLPVMDGDNISVNYADRICTALEMYIDSLQEEPVNNGLDLGCGVIWKEEPVNDELEEAAKRYATEGDEISGLYIIDEEVEAFKAGANWQKEKDKQWIAEEHKHIFAKGRDSMKQQMMKNAIDTIVKVDAGGYPYVDRTIELYDYDKDIPLAKEGDKVKIVVIKED